MGEDRSWGFGVHVTQFLALVHPLRALAETRYHFSVFHPLVSLCVCLSLSLRSPSPPMSLSVSFSLCPCLYLSVSLSLCLSLCLCLSPLPAGVGDVFFVCLFFHVHYLPLWSLGSFLACLLLTLALSLPPFIPVSPSLCAVVFSPTHLHALVFCSAPSLHPHPTPPQDSVFRVAAAISW